MFDHARYMRAKVDVDLPAMEDQRPVPKWELRRERDLKRRRRNMPPSSGRLVEATDGSQVFLWDGLDYPRDEDGRPVPEKTCAAKFKTEDGCWRACWACANGPSCRRAYRPYHDNIPMKWDVTGRLIPVSRWDERLSDRLIRNAVADFELCGMSSEERANPLPLAERLRLYKFYKHAGDVQPWNAADHEAVVAMLTGIPMNAGASGTSEVSPYVIAQGSKVFVNEPCPDRLPTLWVNRWGIKNLRGDVRPPWVRVPTVGTNAVLVRRLALSPYFVNAHLMWLRQCQGKDDLKVRTALLIYAVKVRYAVRPASMCKADFKSMKDMLLNEARTAWKRA